MRDYHARIKPKKRDDILKCFVNDLTAKQTSVMCKVNRKTANHWYRYFREFILGQTVNVPRMSKEVEIDQAFFRTRKKKRYVDTDGPDGTVVHVTKPSKQVAVIGFIERGSGIVYTQVINRMDRRTLMPIIYMVVEDKSTIYTDSWRSFDRLPQDGYIHKKVNHRKGFKVKEPGVHTNNIEAYWSFCKRRLEKFNGLALSTTHLHIKECEFRYNCKKKDMLVLFRKLVKEDDKRRYQMVVKKLAKKTSS